MSKDPQTVKLQAWLLAFNRLKGLENQRKVAARVINAQ